MGYFLDFE